MNAIIKRELKDVSHTGLKTNTPTDYFDYQYSYYLPETKAKIEKAVERMLNKIADLIKAEIEIHKN